MKIKVFTAIGSVIVFLSACTNPSSSSGGGEIPNDPPAAVPELAKPGAVIKALSLGSLVLPRSLQDGSTSSGSRSRAIGDVSTLTSLNLPSLKAQGYYEFKNKLDTASTVKIFLDALKTVPCIADGTLEANTTIDTGDLTLVTPYYQMGLKNSGRLSTSLSSDGKTLKIYWNMLYPDATKISTSPYDPNFQSALDAAPRIVLHMYFIVQAGGAAELFAYRAPDGAGHYMNYWAKYDSSDSTSIEANDSVWGSSPGTSLRLALPQSGSGVFILDRYSSGSYSYESMGYADDSYGGVVRSGSSNYEGISYPWLNVEYYDGTGDLIYQGWGESARNASNWNWRFNSEFCTNLYNLGISRPAAFRLKRIWDGTNIVNYLSFDNGTSWQAFNPDSGFNGYNIVFHNTSSDSGGWVLQTGDAVYWSNGWNSYNSGGNWIAETSYYLGYEVPAGESYFGTTYYVNKTYPLKNLLPLKAQYASGYEVKQKEEMTYYSWEDTSGNWQYGSTAPASGTYKAGTLHSYTSYSYWLENKNYLNSSGVNDNDAFSCDSTKGDVSVQLTDLYVWYWDSAGGQSVSQKTKGFSTYMQSLPPYFAVDQTKMNAVDAVKAKLESLYSSRNGYSVSSYLAGYQAKIDAALPNFPSLDGYPGYVAQ